MYELFLCQKNQPYIWMLPPESCRITLPLSQVLALNPTYIDEGKKGWVGKILTSDTTAYYAKLINFKAYTGWDRPDTT